MSTPKDIIEGGAASSDSPRPGMEIPGPEALQNLTQSVGDAAQAYRQAKEAVQS